MLKLNLNIQFIATLFFGLALSACGGGSSIESPTNQNTNNPSGSSQPIQISQSNLQNVDMLSRTEFPAPTVTSDNGFLIITHTSNDISDDKHYQFFLNTDNDSDTGFRFFGKILWAEIGADYLVEDGLLFEKDAEGYPGHWNWHVDIGDIEYIQTDSSITVKINHNLLQGLSPQIRVGFVIRDENWDVLSVWPGSSLMAQYSIDVSPPIDTVAPVISLNGANSIEILRNTTFNDPGATATDNIDIDLTIYSTSNLDTSTNGTYTITYTVSDQAGNQSEISRTVIVKSEISNGIIVDGSINDWTDINTFVESIEGTIKVSDDNENLYVLIIGNELDENTQLFLDVDNNSATGYQFTGSVWNQGGADYMIENRDLSKSLTNDSVWSWDYSVADITYVRSANNIELAIPKGALENLGDSINIGFVNRDTDWRTTSVFPVGSLSNYYLSNDTQILSSQLKHVEIVSFCGSIWGSDGTINGTKKLFADNNDLISHLTSFSRSTIDGREYKGNWYVLYQSENSTNLNPNHTVLKYDGQVVSVIIDNISLRGTGPVGQSASRTMAFLKDYLYYIHNNGLWRISLTNNNADPEMNKQFDNVLTEVGSTENYLVYRELGLNWSYMPSTGKHTLLSDYDRTGFLPVGYADNLLNDGDIAYFLDKMDDSRFFQTDGTREGTIVTNFNPSLPRTSAVIIQSNSSEFWVEDQNGIRTILARCD